MRLVFGLLVLMTACSSVTYSERNEERQRHIQAYCNATEGSADGLWQCKQYYLRGSYAVPTIPASPTASLQPTNAGNIDEFCSTVPGGEFGIWQCKQYYTRLYGHTPTSPQPSVTPQAHPVERVASAAPNRHEGLPSSSNLQVQGGTFIVSVLVNNAISLNFTVDSGAADVSIPADVVLTLMRTGTIESSDFLGRQIYQLANGSTVPSETFRIRSLKVGDREVRDVRGSVAPVSGSLLLGQSFLSRFKSWSIDNQRKVLHLE
jgi:clan AA aspartic protease (TIGR02281 family)